MAYELEIEESATEAIVAYLDERWPKGREREEAIDIIQSKLERLAEDPVRLGRTPHPAVSFPAYRFKAKIDGMERLFNVVFRYAQDEKSIWIIGFSPLLNF